MKTIRLKVPEWQGGNKPEYAFGSDLLSWLAPTNANQKEVEIAIPKYSTPLVQENGVYGQSIVLNTLEEIKATLRDEKPDRVITLGGDCHVSQAPFDYLHGKYKDEVGIIWIDSHPDISTPDIFYHEHAMVLGNLLGYGDPVLANKVDNPYKVEDVLYVGLQEPTDDEKKLMKEMNLNYAVQKDKRISPSEIQMWLTQNQFSKVVVHFDLDVLNPKEFYSLYFTEPGNEEYSAESGKMSLREVQDTLTAISNVSEIVGLTVAEYLPWDADNLKKLFKTISIFE